MYWIYAASSKANFSNELHGFSTTIVDFEKLYYHDPKTLSSGK